MSIGAVSIYPIGCRKLKKKKTADQCTVQCSAVNEVFVNDGSARLGLLEGVENWLF